MRIGSVPPPKHAQRPPSATRGEFDASLSSIAGWRSCGAKPGFCLPHLIDGNTSNGATGWHYPRFTRGHPPLIPTGTGILSVQRPFFSSAT